MITCYCLTSGQSSKLGFYANVYAYPFFHQNWQLFAPPPETNYHLYVSAGDTAGTDIFQEILIRHRQNRFAGNGALLLTFVNSIHYFEKNTSERKKLNGPVRNDPYFSMLEYSAKKYFQQQHAGTALSAIKIKLLVKDLETGDARVYFN